MQEENPLEQSSQKKDALFYNGSEAHKNAFCTMLLDTHDPYKPKILDWPKLTSEERQRLVDLPIWNMAVQVEGQASINVLSYTDAVSDPLLKKAVEMNGQEEARHRLVLSNLTAAYGIKLDPEPEYKKLADTEYGYMFTGYSECVDSFFAFGLFELAKKSGFFPMELVETFEPIMQEEGRHILFFVNWAMWHRHNLSRYKKILFDIKRFRVFIDIFIERTKTAKSIHGESTQHNDNFTITPKNSINVDINLVDFLEICIKENDRRLSIYDMNLLRPKIVPYSAKVLYHVAKSVKKIYIMIRPKAIKPSSPN